MIIHRQFQLATTRWCLVYLAIWIGFLGCKKESSQPQTNLPSTAPYSEIIDELEATKSRILNSPGTDHSAAQRIESAISLLKSNDQALSEQKPLLLVANLIHDNAPMKSDEADRFYILGLAPPGGIDRVEATDTKGRIILTENKPDRLQGHASIDGKLSIFAIAFYVPSSKLNGNLSDAISVRVFLQDGSQSGDLTIYKAQPVSGMRN